MRFEIGQKVKIPKTKSVWNTVEESVVIENAKKINQDFLFVTGIEEEDENIMLDTSLSNSGDFFLKSDLELYEEEFVLPEKWYVIVTKENENILSNWRFDNVSHCKPELNPGDVVGYIKDSIFKQWDRKHIYSKSSLWVNEITFNQFKQHVLHQQLKDLDKMENKQIIGYNIKPEFKHKTKHITNILDTVDTITTKNVWLPNYGQVYQNAVDLNVLDLWFEPVYALQYKAGDYVTDDNGESIYVYSHLEKGLHYSTKNNLCLGKDLRKTTPEEIQKGLIKLPTINSYSGKLEGDYIIYGNNCAKFHKQFFLQILEASEYNEDKGNRKIESIKLNSGVTIAIDQIEEIVDYIKYYEK